MRQHLKSPITRPWQGKGTARSQLALCLACLVLILGACAPQYQPAGALHTSPAMLSHAVLMGDGYRLPYRYWAPIDGARGVILAVHGFNDYAFSFHGAANRFAEAGFHTYAYDQRGFGYTENRGVWPGRKTLIDDLETVVHLVQARHPGLPIFLMGESMGAAVVLSALGSERIGPCLKHQVTGAVLSAPAVWSRRFMNGLYRASLDITFALAPTMTVRPPSSLRIRASNNLETLISLGSDPLVLKSTRVDAIQGVVDLMDAAQEAAPRIDRPTLVIYGEQDQIIPRAPVDHLAETLPTAISAYRTYQNGHHLLLRDLKGDQIADDVLAWMDATLSEGQQMASANTNVRSE